MGPEMLCQVSAWRNASMSLPPSVWMMRFKAQWVGEG